MSAWEWRKMNMKMSVERDRETRWKWSGKKEKVRERMWEGEEKKQRKGKSVAKSKQLIKKAPFLFSPLPKKTTPRVQGKWKQQSLSLAGWMAGQSVCPLFHPFSPLFLTCLVPNYTCPKEEKGAQIFIRAAFGKCMDQGQNSHCTFVRIKHKARVHLYFSFKRSQAKHKQNKQTTETDRTDKNKQKRRLEG